MLKDDRGKNPASTFRFFTKIFIQQCRRLEVPSRPLRRFLRLLIVGGCACARFQCAILTCVAASAVLDIVLSKTQRKTPTQIHKGFKISRIRSLCVPRGAMLSQALS